MEHERIILVKDCLERRMNQGVTKKEILQYIEQNSNITPPTPVTLQRDIDRLINMGHKIEISHGAHNTCVYTMISNSFTFNEIRFIVDSISINKFLSDEQKKQLIKKFQGMCSEKDVRQLISRISLNGRGSPSLDLLENLDKVHKSISERRKINFDYGKYDLQKDVVYKSKKRDIVPIKVIYFEERFYLKCLNTETSEIRTYRIDRMTNIKTGLKYNKKITIPEYDGFVLDMFEPEFFETVRFRVKRFLLDEMLEIFGEDTFCRDDNEKEDCFIITKKIGINESFYRRVMRYGSNIEILSPENIRSKFCEELSKISDNYK